MARHNKEGKQFAEQMKKGRDQVDEFASKITDPVERRRYLSTIAGVRAELRSLDKQRSRREHVLEDASAS